ncbi:type IV pilus biogenesis protein PilP [Rahnella sp. BCC 1045]|uniref:type IV pilus biogenesis protein PilP n=1 Tax=Rahnella sp. BCC 1045 TaxID=2816251 RepID=UPI001C266CD9|nr:type IV pilus biogenesis protein PilP [Rahnella sp. BCC 1045]MBU9819870.1 type IV pilus biogenesis protein PilP [Rahnella sp. BCC 1045]
MHNVNPASRFWLLGIFAAFCQPSLAAETPVSAEAGNVTIGQLEAIQSRNFLLEQQVQTARLTRQLRESESETQTSQAANVPPSLPFIPSGPPTTGVVQQAARAASDRGGQVSVRLQEIYGRGSQLRARIVLPQGGVTEVSVGDQLPDSKVSVKSITVNTVKLSDGTELSF